MLSLLSPILPVVATGIFINSPLFTPDASLGFVNIAIQPLNFPRYPHLISYPYFLGPAYTNITIYPESFRLSTMFWAIAI